MSDRRSHSLPIGIPADHPSLPGHFPGRPIVPGVVLLDCVIASAERWLQRPLSLRALPQAKFVAPLLPAEPAELRLSIEGEDLRFDIVRAGATLASGAFKVRLGPA
jgi:3-hydroxymyristoyl/3-hydroxydecanoyl-(acyl carrier protein) dehydratase